jgi:hypothetical protein
MSQRRLFYSSVALLFVGIGLFANAGHLYLKESQAGRPIEPEWLGRLAFVLIGSLFGYFAYRMPKRDT